MLKYKIRKQIDLNDWDQLVQDTYDKLSKIESKKLTTLVLMKLVYCKKDYNFFEEGKTYYVNKIMYRGGMIRPTTYTQSYLIYDRNNKDYKVGEIGYLYSEVFEDLETHRDRLLNEILN